jgi:ribosome-binding protein aMBF1 (putative translation factor)
VLGLFTRVVALAPRIHARLRRLATKPGEKSGLEAKGWKVGSAKEFLGLSSQEEAYIEIKLRLAENLRNQRLRRQMTQSDLAKAIKSSQSRVAKTEAGERSVSLDLMVRILLARFSVSMARKGATFE